LAEDLKKYLYQLQERLSLAAQSYQQKCNALYAAGMMEETLNKLMQEYMPSTCEQIMNVVAQINERDIPFIEKHIAILEQPRNMIYKGYSGTPVYRIDGNMIYEGYNNTPVYRIEGNKIYEGYSGKIVYRIDGNMIYEGYNNTPVYRIEGKMIYEGYSGTPVNRIE